MILLITPLPLAFFLKVVPGCCSCSKHCFKFLDFCDLGLMRKYRKRMLSSGPSFSLKL